MVCLRPSSDRFKDGRGSTSNGCGRDSATRRVVHFIDRLPEASTERVERKSVGRSVKKNKYIEPSCNAVTHAVPLMKSGID